ncbi:MAG: peptidoglycan DD-metalloendopeptidase family protein [Lentimicrobium sp.]|nr:peptidoglycan DD-metalloendopeptidase family protein [Lentimicrobium sp.]
MNSRVIFFQLLFSSTFIVVSTQYAVAQAFAIDTATFLNAQDAIISDSEEVQFHDEILPEDEERPLTDDSIFIPSVELYKNKWDTLYIRTGMPPVSEIHDSVFIWLNNPNETPFHFPFKGKLISKYGWRGSRFHAGMDVKLTENDTVVSAFDGKVRIARVMSGYGKMVVIRHHNGLETVYSHFSKILVSVNQEVKAGQPIGIGGRTGRATTTHLHFETRYLGEHFSPDRIFDFENYTLIKDTLLIDRAFWQTQKNITETNTFGGEVVNKYHTIRQGDTLTSIAKRYKTSVNRLCQLNGISQKKTLKIGTRLRVA